MPAALPTLAAAQPTDLGQGPNLLARALTTWRARNQLTRRHAAQQLGVTTSTVFRWEHGVRPQQLLHPRIAAVLHVDSDWVADACGSTGSASRLQAARLAAGLTSGQVALRLRVTRSAVSRWESGSKRPSAKARPELARLLQIDPVRLETLLGPTPAAPQVLPGLASLRRGRDLSQRDLAARLQISHGAVARWERGRPVPAHRTSDIAHALGLSLEAFGVAAAGPGDPPRPPSHLGQLRHRAGMTQAEVAAHLQIGKGTLSRLETGRTPLTPFRAHQLAALYRVAAAAVWRAVPVEQRAPLPATAEYTHIARVLAEHRIARGLSANAMAAALGVSPATYRGWEKSGRIPSARHLHRLRTRIDGLAA